MKHIVLVMGLLLCLLFGPGTSWADDNEDNCKTVGGAIAASLTGDEVPTVMGTVTGTLRGAVIATVVEQSPGPNGQVLLKLRHTFLTEGRDLLRTEDQSVWTPVDGLPGVFQMSTQYTIVGGTGIFTHARGRLQNHGEVDLNTGQITLSLSGRVCRAD